MGFFDDERFRDRSEAGRRLARSLMRFKGRDDVVILALPRGGVPVAFEIAQAIDAPLDVLVVRKLGVPGHRELAMGAVADGGIVIRTEEVIQQAGVSQQEFDAVLEEELRELRRRELAYRGDRPEPNVRGRTVLLIDDGLATGSTMKAAIQALLQLHPARIVVGSPVGAPAAVDDLRNYADEVHCPVQPSPFYAVGQSYVSFRQTTDQEVRDLLARARAPEPVSAAVTRERPVRFQAGGVTLHGDLTIPQNASGLVVFVHGSGSSRHSPRNRFVAHELRQGGLATLLFDLLTEDEEQVDLRTRHLRFDIDLLAERLVGATDWLLQQRETRDLPIGYFGSSTGGAAALVGAVQRPDRIAAVVSRGGRPDLAGDALPAVRAPTLLIVGERDQTVLALNRQARRRMTSAEVDLETVPGATHLFEEPGTLQAVAGRARTYFAEQFERVAFGPAEGAAADREVRPSP